MYVPSWIATCFYALFPIYPLASALHLTVHFEGCLDQPTTSKQSPKKSSEPQYSRSTPSIWRRCEVWQILACLYQLLAPMACKNIHLAPETATFSETKHPHEGEACIVLGSCPSLLSVLSIERFRTRSLSIKQRLGLHCIFCQLPCATGGRVLLRAVHLPAHGIKSTADSCFPSTFTQTVIM
jgi:hypothetical protein